MRSKQLKKICEDVSCHFIERELKCDVPCDKILGKLFEQKRYADGISSL